MATFLFVVALLNVCLGYALAVYLGHALPEAMDGSLQTAPRPSGPFAPQPVAAPKPADPVAPPAAPAPSAPVVVKQPEPPVVNAVINVVAVEESPEEPEADEPAAESPLAEFQTELDRYRGQLSELDSRMRDCAGSEDDKLVQEYLRDLKETSQQYVQQQTESLDRLRQEPESGPADWVRVQVGEAVADQVAEIDTVNQHLAEVDLDTDLAAGLQKMLNQASKLLQSNQQFQESLDETQLQIARAEMTPEENVAALPIENLSDGQEFSAAAANIWQAEQSDVRPITMAIIDVDNFRDFTSAHGIPVADRVLHSIAQIVGSIVRSGDLATRVGGQKFVLMFPKTSARDSTTFVERVRQMVGASQFKRGDEELTLSVSCALTEALADDTHETLLARAESTLQEAKRYGRNRTFLHEGKYAAPVVPPRFAIEPRVLEV